MVARKYLCSSPHPDTWDERAAALLKSLGGSKARRRRILRDTLASLDTDNLVRKELRPGRKTHAEHAIAFYRHVLNLNEEDAASDQVEEDKGGGGGGGGEEIKSRKRHANKRKRDSSKAEGDSVLSMDSEEFLSQHNDLCEVCNGAGELICCSTCNLVFHLKCIRPPTTRLPPDHWSCAYCVAAGIKGHAKEARTRRRAAAASREMTRLKHELNTQETSDSEDTDGKPKTKEKKAKASEKLSSETVGETVQEDEMDDGKPKAKKQKVDDDGSAEEDVEGTERRPRRPRRQPALYNPQAVAASRWQSDGVIEWKTMGREKHASADGDNKESSDDEEVSEEPIWCNFCEDDPSIAVCCFCACRVCFGKHDASQLLLCDKCDDEYHTFCLDPPLTSVPNSKKWFCPSCDPSNKKEVKESPAPSPKKSKRSPRKAEPAVESMPAVESTPPVKNGPGRPRKNLIADTSGSVKSVDSQPPVKRCLGRPKKNPVVDIPDSGKSVKSTPPKRGRPRKNPVSQTDTQKSAQKLSGSQKNDESVVVKRPRGRPRKSVQSPQTDGKKTPTQRNDSASKASTRPGGNDGMPLVTPASATNPGDKDASVAVSGMQMSTDASKTPLSLQKSRSGRTVKRGTFHDEIDQGEQHLKTARLSMEPPQKRVSLEPSQTHASLEPQDTGDRALRGQKPSTEIGLQQLQASQSIPKQLLDEKPPAKIGVPSSLAQSQSTPAIAVSAAPTTLPTPTVLSLPSAGAVSTPTLTQVSTSVSKVSSTATAPAPQQDARSAKVPRRKPGARECMQISRRFGVKVIPQKYMETLEDYCTRGKVEHLIRMRERLDDHSRMLEAQLAGLEALIKEKGETEIIVPAADSTDDTRTP